MGVADLTYDIYEWMVIAVARVGRRVPAVDLALRDAISHLAAAIPLVDDPEAWVSPHGRGVGRAAFTHVLAIGQLIGAAREDHAAGEDSAIALRAVRVVLDVLAPFVGTLDRAVSTLVIAPPPALTPYAELAITVDAGEPVTRSR